MILPGICSITLKTLAPEEIIRFAVESKLQAIEWWGSGHVLPGDLARASAIRRFTHEAGLRVSSYGSYYRAGVSDTLSFTEVLDTAEALGAPTIRVWAGNKNREEADDALINKVIMDTNRIASLAAARGISITFEFHGGTLTNSSANALRFAFQVPHENVFFSWQQPHGFALEQCLSGLEGLLPRLSTLHVYHWTIGSYAENIFDESQRTPSWPGDFYRHPLQDGADRWRSYLNRARTTGRDHCALLEFVRDYSVEEAKADAAVLVKLCLATGD